MSASYLFEHTWDEERRRLELLQDVFDPATRQYLDRIPVPAGGRCLEIGGGAGSIARWFCQRVGPGGQVVATDLETTFLEALTEENLEVRRHDIVTDDLEDAAYDLIHARLVLEHLPARDDVLRRLVGALRPGGWLVLEDFDWSSILATPACTSGALHSRAYAALRTVFAGAGAATEYGRRLPLDFRAAGLVDVGAEGRVHVALGGTPAARWWALTLEKLCAPLAANGDLSAAEVAEVVSVCADQGFCAFFPVLVMTWGRRPG